MPTINISTFYSFCEQMIALELMQDSALVELDETHNHNYSHHVKELPVKWCAEFMRRHGNG